MKEHIDLIHKGKRPHICSICSKGFSKPSHLKQHILGHDKDDYKDEEKDKLFPCPKCDVICVSNVRLKSHMKNVHYETKTHLCSYCGKYFGTAIGKSIL